MQHQQNHQMQFAPNHVVATGIGSNTSYDPTQQQQLHQHITMSPNAAPQMNSVTTNLPQRHIISMNPHQQQQQHHHHHQHHQQSQMIGPVGGLLSPRPPSLTPNSNDQAEHSETDHDQIIDQVISLENEFSDTSAMLTSVDGSDAGLMMSHQQHHLGDINLSGGVCASEVNQFSNSHEDFLNLLMEFGESSNLLGLGDGQQLDQDEKAGIENIRKQLMSCEVQSEQLQHHNTNSMSPIVNQMTCPPQQPPRQATHQQQQQQQQRNSVHQQQVTQHQPRPQLISQTAPVISHHLQPHASYSSLPMSNVPVSTSGQSYAPQQPPQHVARISQSNTMSMEPSPVVKKNPLLNAQLVNSRGPSITPTRFMNSQPNVLNQNPILNAKLSQNSFVTSSGIVSPVNPNLNSQSRYIQQQSNFNYDITTQQQHQQQNAQQAGHMTIYGPSDQQQRTQQPTNQIFGTVPTSTGMSPVGGASMNMGDTSPSGGLSQQVKQEIRRKVQQPKQQHQTTSLLKQLLSDDNK